MGYVEVKVKNPAAKCPACGFAVGSHYWSNGVFEPFKPECPNVGVIVPVERAWKPGPCERRVP